MAQQPQCSLFGILVDQLFGDIDAGMKTQVAEVIRTILDPELMEGACEKDDFLNVFYDNYMERLVMCITAEKPVRDKMALYKSDRKQVDSDEALVAHTRNQVPSHRHCSYSSILLTATGDKVCEILAFCVQSHGYRIKYFILRHNIVQKALGLITPKAKVPLPAVPMLLHDLVLLVMCQLRYVLAGEPFNNGSYTFCSCLCWFKR